MKSLVVHGTRIFGLAAIVFAVHPACADLTPIPLGSGANASFIDDYADDKKGGFIDLGSNDLRMLPSGMQNIGGIDFDILPAATSADKSCIVLGGNRRPYLPQSAEVRLDEPVAAQCLYLLHGSAFTSANGKPIVGSLHLVYSDGSREERHVRVGRDVGGWIGSSRSYGNAVRAWTIYNRNTQVSLYVSTFQLASGRKLASLSFTSDTGVWFVAGVTVGERRVAHKVVEDLSINRSYRIPDRYEKPLPVYPAGAKPRNVVFFLGDGMGLGSLVLASNYLYHRPGALLINQLPFAGLATTYSASSDVTDSGASATAFACGHKTRNTMIGVLPDGTHVNSVAARAHDAGFAIGLLTDDSFNGATPAAYFAHVKSRSEYSVIAAQAAKSDYEIMLGIGCREWFLPTGKDGGLRRDGRDIIAEMTGRGYSFCETYRSFFAAPRDRRVLGCIRKGDLDDELCFRDLTDNALARLSSGGRRFFVMIETDNVDHGSHAGKPEDTVLGVVKAEWSVRRAVDWSLAHGGDTLVVVMADHETGGLNTVVSASTGRVSLHYGVTSHTSAPVPVHAFGPGAELFEGVYDTTDVAKRLAKLLDLEL